jgi:hypothetical protein
MLIGQSASTYQGCLKSPPVCSHHRIPGIGGASVERHVSLHVLQKSPLPFRESTRSPSEYMWQFCREPPGAKPPPRTTGRGTAPVDTVPAGGDPAGTWPRRPGSATAVPGRCSRNNLHALREPYSNLHALWIYGGPPPPTFHHHVPGALQQPARARVGPR